MNKSLADILVLTLFLALSGCTRGETDQNTIVFSYGEGGELKEEAIAELVSRFEKQNSGSKVFLHPIPTSSDGQRLFYLTSLGSHSNFIDVFEADVIWTSEFAGAELLLDLSDVPAFSNRELFVEQLVRQATYNNKLYAAPYSANYSALFYRRDLLEKHGLRPPRSLDELTKQASALSQAEGIAGFVWQAKDYEGLTCNFLDFYRGFGGEISVDGDRVSLDREKTQQTLQFMYDSIHTHQISPDFVLDHIEIDSNHVFRNGQAVFMRNWHNALRYVERGSLGENIGVAVMPPGRGSLTGGWQLAINARTTNRELALRFIEFMVSTESQRFLAQRRGQGPALRELYPTLENGPVIPEGALNRIVVRPQSPYYFEFSVVTTEETRSVLNKTRTVEQATENIIERTEQLELDRQAPPDFPESHYMTRYRP